MQKRFVGFVSALLGLTVAAAVLTGLSPSTARASAPACPHPPFPVSVRAIDSYGLEYRPSGGSSFASVTVLLTGQILDGATISWNTHPGLAYEGADYTAMHGHTTLTSSPRSYTIKVPILDDIESEGTEAFAVQWSYVDPGGCSVQTTATDDTSVVNLIDNEGPLTLSAVDSNGYEGTGACSVCPKRGPRFVLNRPSSADLSIGYKTQDGNATAASHDYTPAGGGRNASVSLPAGQLSVVAPVTVGRDATVESDEHFNVIIGAVTSSGLVAINTVRQAAHVDLFNDDVAQPQIANSTNERMSERTNVSPSAPCADPVHGVRLHAADSVIREYHSGGTYTLGLVGVRFEGATVQGAKVGYKTFPGTADENSDFVPASGSETLNSGSVISMDTGVSVALDSESEGTESFTVRWSYSDPSGCSYQMSSPDNTTVVNILDNQGPLTLTAVDASRREGNSCTTCDSVGVLLMANRPAPNDVTIAYDTTDATAKAGSDYVAKHSSATLPQGKLGLLVFIGVLGDNTVEPDEHFNVVIGQQTTSGQAFTVIRKSAHVDLLNDDA